jgi:hypothetical protein
MAADERLTVTSWYKELQHLSQFIAEKTYINVSLPGMSDTGSKASGLCSKMM